MTAIPLFQLFVEPLEAPEEYLVKLRQPSGEQSQGHIHIPTKSPSEGGFIGPAIEFDGKAWHVIEQAKEAGRIDLIIPDLHVAGVDWEGMIPGRLLRRTPESQGVVLGTPARLPLRIGIVSACSVRSTKYGELGQLVESMKAAGPRGAIEVELIDVKDEKEFARALATGHFDVVHAITEIDLSSPTQPGVITGSGIRVQDLVRDVAEANARFCFLHETGASARATSYLRMGAQNLPAGKQLSVVALNAALSEESVGQMIEFYKGLVADVPFELDPIWWTG